MNKKAYINRTCSPVLFFCFLLAMLCIAACSDNPVEGTEDTTPTATEVYDERLTEVETAILELQTFQKEIISQGKVKARREIEVPFTSQGIIKKVAIAPGQKVSKGDLLVQMDDFSIQNQIEKLEAEMVQTRLTMENHFINLGYNPDFPDSIPDEIRNNAAIEFNLPIQENERKRLEHERVQTRIVAPFSGVISDVRVNEGAHSSAYQKVCTLVDNQQLFVEFPVLESEIHRVANGQEIGVEPFFQRSNDTGLGRIVQISPVVNEEGMIVCRAQLQSPSNILMDGMRVNIYIRDAIPDVIVLPKTAVVDRQNKLVVFTLQENRAYWNYVELQDENSTSYLIREGIEVGDTIILSNNFDLAHLEEVKVVDKQENR
ncbi:efflux RND transporter periplasmic adaptor subunit [Membranihabitans maritimus]|uniref:efflux RND transporter periplasmic adaptor subunit n=1 Tax=Membranihabitans maritimus TaxID=2904244 RepID=UPI001F01B000|nr:efflux RND transporter periplasmic adaptor subunit [Membranihabitans maritimus]